jgi:ABC-type transport system involved in cytochrome c biogenesis permease subunit
MLLWIALALYGLGVVLTLPSVASRRPALPRPALIALCCGLAFHGASLSVGAWQLHHLPVTDMRSAISFFAFDLTVAFLIIYLRYRLVWLGLFMLPFVFLLALGAALQAGPSFDSSGFRGGWVAVHVASMFLGYTGFFITFAAAAMYLIQERQLKSKHVRPLYHRLPSLEICDLLYYRSLVFGNLFLALGLITGFVWASRTWRGPWQYDPKILATLITWLIYLVLFSARASGTWPGRRSAYGAIFGFAAVMVTFLGVTFLSGQHGFLPRP